MSRASKKLPVERSRNASNTVAVSSTVRQLMPGRSRYGSAPMPPPYEIMPFVGTKVTTPLCVPGLRHEPPVDSQIEQTTRFAATDAPEPPLEPPVSRVAS